jgi:hypothetical protein
MSLLNDQIIFTYENSQSIKSLLSSLIRLTNIFVPAPKWHSMFFSSTNTSALESTAGSSRKLFVWVLETGSDPNDHALSPSAITIDARFQSTAPFSVPLGIEASATAVADLSIFATSFLSPWLVYRPCAFSSLISRVCP